METTSGAYYSRTAQSIGFATHAWRSRNTRRGHDQGPGRGGGGEAGGGFARSMSGQLQNCIGPKLRGVSGQVSAGAHLCMGRPDTAAANEEEYGDGRSCTRCRLRDKARRWHCRRPGGADKRSIDALQGRVYPGSLTARLSHCSRRGFVARLTGNSRAALPMLACAPDMHPGEATL